jgi:hypothetical protein
MDISLYRRLEDRCGEIVRERHNWAALARLAREVPGPRRVFLIGHVGIVPMVVGWLSSPHARDRRGSVRASVA